MVSEWSSVVLDAEGCPGRQPGGLKVRALVIIDGLGKDGRIEGRERVERVNWSEEED